MEQQFHCRLLSFINLYILHCFTWHIVFSAKERYRNTAKDLLLPNTVSQKDEKPHTSGLDDTAIPHIKIKITKITLEKKLNTAIP